MRTRTFAALRAALVLGLLPATMAACGSKMGTVAAAAAGTGAAIVLSNQDASAEVNGSISNLDRRTRAVFSNMGLSITKSTTEDNATEREYEARSGDRVVHVKLEQRTASTTKVNVSSRRGTTLDYDTSHARMVVERIQQQR